MTLIGPYLSIFTLNLDGLNFLMKSHRVAEWIKTNKWTITTTGPNYVLPKGDPLQL